MTPGSTFSQATNAMTLTIKCLMSLQNDRAPWQKQWDSCCRNMSTGTLYQEKIKWQEEQHIGWETHQQLMRGFTQLSGFPNGNLYTYDNATVGREESVTALFDCTADSMYLVGTTTVLSGQEEPGSSITAYWQATYPKTKHDWQRVVEFFTNFTKAHIVTGSHRDAHHDQILPSVGAPITLP